jgi:hypothetical protein
MRRAEIGHHHHIAGVYLLRYAQEASWREDNRRVTNGEQIRTIAALAMRRFSGFLGLLAATRYQQNVAFLVRPFTWNVPRDIMSIPNKASTGIL